GGTLMAVLIAQPGPLSARRPPSQSFVRFLLRYLAAWGGLGLLFGVFLGFSQGFPLWWPAWVGLLLGSVLGVWLSGAMFAAMNWLISSSARQPSPEKEEAEPLRSEGLRLLPV